MTYDGENRPLSVTSANGDVTEYVYAADGSRLWRTVTEGAVTTKSLYFSEMEIVNPAAGSSSGEVVNWYPHPNVKITHTRPTGTKITTPTYLHRDQLDSVVLIADASGGEDLERIYEPFGSDTEFGIPGGEDIGFIGERKDTVAGLHYLNARYYDPELAMFIQPDWFEVTLAGVGTNRYAYSGNDPVNMRDPGGNNFEPGGSEYGVDTDGDGAPDAFDRGYGVGGAAQAQNGNPAIHGSFSSGSQFAGFSKSVTSSQQAQSLANSGMTQAENYRAFQDGLNDLALGLGLLAAPGEIVLGAGLAAGRAAIGTLGSISSQAVPTSRVGRWMGKTELDEMLSTGHVVESKSGLTHVASPASPSVFGRQAPKGSSYVEFSVPTKSLSPSSTGIATIVTPNSRAAARLSRVGRPVPTQSPQAIGVKVLGLK